MPGDDTTAAVGDTNYRREGVEEEGDDKVSESVPDPSEHMNFISFFGGRRRRLQLDNDCGACTGSDDGFCNDKFVAF